MVGLVGNRVRGQEVDDVITIQELYAYDRGIEHVDCHDLANARNDLPKVPTEPLVTRASVERAAVSLATTAATMNLERRDGFCEIGFVDRNQPPLNLLSQGWKNLCELHVGRGRHKASAPSSLPRLRSNVEKSKIARSARPPAGAETLQSDQRPLTAQSSTRCSTPTHR